MPSKSNLLQIYYNVSDGYEKKCVYVRFYLLANIFQETFETASNIYEVFAKDMQNYFYVFCILIT